MIAAGAIFGAFLWGAMLWFFVGPSISRRLGGARRGGHRQRRRPTLTTQRIASGRGKGSTIAEPGMVSGIAGSVVAETRGGRRDSSLRHAA
jgi:hypothetical protein